MGIKTERGEAYLCSIRVLYAFNLGWDNLLIQCVPSMMSSCGRKKILIKSAFCGFYYLSQAPLTDVLSILNQNLFKAKKNTSKEYWELSLRQHPQDHNRCSLVSADTTITSTFFFRPRNLCPMNESAPPSPLNGVGTIAALIKFFYFSLRCSFEGGAYECSHSRITR